MKSVKKKIQRMFFERNGEFRIWVLLVINVWFAILAVLALLEVIR